nr:Na+/H+ antiporter NhaC [Mammaliicoccus sp. Marseille-Q6498]
MSNEKTSKKNVSFGWAIVPFIFMIVSMIFAVVVLEQAPHIPLMIGTAIAAIVAYFHGYSWEEIEEMMYKGIKLALPAIVIIILVGLIIGAWIGGGVVATMIYYGLKLITPSLFLVAITVICAIVSLAIGSSWSTMATVGVAGMGIGLSMDIPAGMIAGGIISGSYFGDKMSPLSDTTNLAAGLTGTDLFEHIRHMFYTTVPAVIISLITFFILGQRFSADNMNQNKINAINNEMLDKFVISPWLLLIPLAVIVLVALKVPAIPALVVGIILGFLSQIFIQGGSLHDSVQALQTGYVLETKNELVKELFNRGGLESMFYTISMTIVAMTFGGILEYSGMLKAIINQILKIAKGTGGLIASVIISCIGTNASCSEQYISIVVPSRMYISTFLDKRLHPKNLSRALEDGGTVTSVFFLWNTCGVFIAQTLNVNVLDYGIYAVFNYSVPIISMIFGFVGYKIITINEEEYKKFTEA